MLMGQLQQVAPAAAMITSLLCFTFANAANDIRSEASHFEEVIPMISSTGGYVHLQDAEILTADSLNFNLTTHGHQLVITASKYMEIFHKDYKEAEVDLDGNIVIVNRKAPDCIFRGYVHIEGHYDVGLAHFETCTGGINGVLNHPKASFELQFLPDKDSHVAVDLDNIKIPKQISGGCGVGTHHHEPFGHPHDHDNYNQDAASHHQHHHHHQQHQHYHHHHHHHHRHHHQKAHERRGQHNFHLPVEKNLSVSTSRHRSYSFDQVDSTIRAFRGRHDGRGGGTPQLQAAQQCTNAPTKYVSVLVINDHKRYTTRGVDTQTHSASLLSLSDTLYFGDSAASIPGVRGAGFNCYVRVRLIGQLTWRNGNPSSIRRVTSNCQATCGGNNCGNGEVSVNCLLDDVSSYSSTHKTNLEAIFGTIDNYMLFSDENFSGSTVGLAWVGTMCRDYFSTSANQVSPYSSNTIAVILAHEMGHNFGMSHDTVNGKIMSPSVSGAAKDFTAASRGDIDTFFSNSNPTCLDDDRGDVWTAGYCGNGIVESGEQCDPGYEFFGSDPGSCCNSDCTQPANCQCDSSEPCCDNGQFIPAGAVCRAAQHATCDVPEVCSGSSGECPTDLFLPSTQSCVDTRFDQTGSGKCYKGDCISPMDTCPSAVPIWDEGCSLATPSGESNICHSVCCYAAGQDASTDYHSAEDGTPCSVGAITDGICVSNTDAQFGGSDCVAASSIHFYHWSISCPGGTAVCRDEQGLTVTSDKCADGPPQCGATTAFPTKFPTEHPSAYPTNYPTNYPTPPTSFPTPYPGVQPSSAYPTPYPTPIPTTSSPTPASPTKYPTTYPPSLGPTASPSSLSPSSSPRTNSPLPAGDTAEPTATPSITPPTRAPLTTAPTRSPATSSPLADGATAAPTTATPTALFIAFPVRLDLVWAAFSCSSLASEVEKATFLLQVRRGVAYSRGLDINRVAIQSSDCGSTVVTVVAQPETLTDAQALVQEANTNPLAIFSVANGFDSSTYGAPTTSEATLIIEAPPASDSGDHSNGDDTGVVVAGIFGALVGVLLLAAILWYVHKRLCSGDTSSTKESRLQRRRSSMRLDQVESKETKDLEDDSGKPSPSPNVVSPAEVELQDASANRKKAMNPYGRAQLDPWWTIEYAEDGTPYYFNTKTQKSQWQHPGTAI